MLESLTGFSFPRAPWLCTHYATQITCRREIQKSVVVSIIPRPYADKELKDRLRQFERRAAEINDTDLAKIFEDVSLASRFTWRFFTDQRSQANIAMRIRKNPEDKDPRLAAFTEDILKIEVFGPEAGFIILDLEGN